MVETGVSRSDAAKLVPSAISQVHHPHQPGRRCRAHALMIDGSRRNPGTNSFHLVKSMSPAPSVAGSRARARLGCSNHPWLRLIAMTEPTRREGSSRTCTPTCVHVTGSR